MLILTCNTTDIRAIAAHTVLESLGTPYDIVAKSYSGPTQFSLTNPDGSGRYYAIVAATEFGLCWTVDEQNTIADYENRFQV